MLLSADSAARTQAYTQTVILHFADGTSGVHTVKSIRRPPAMAVTGPASARCLAEWQDMNPSITGVTIQYDHAPEVRPATTGKGFAIFAGRDRLSRWFHTAEMAQHELDNRAAFYAYWAGSAGVSVNNA